MAEPTARPLSGLIDELRVDGHLLEEEHSSIRCLINAAPIAEALARHVAVELPLENYGAGIWTCPGCNTMKRTSHREGCWYEPLLELAQKYLEAVLAAAAEVGIVVSSTKEGGPMKVSDIIREPLVEPQSVDSLTVSIHEAAKVELGYACHARTNRDPEVDSELLQAIRALGIEVLNAHSVRRYQGVKVAEAYATSETNSFDFSWRSDPEWQRSDLKSYTKPIPDFALERALQIKKRVPQCEFWIEELSYHVDPFLIAHVGRDGYYIAVWEEATFEASIESHVAPYKSDDGIPF